MASYVLRGCHIQGILTTVSPFKGMVLSALVISLSFFSRKIDIFNFIWLLWLDRFFLGFSTLMPIIVFKTFVAVQSRERVLFFECYECMILVVTVSELKRALLREFSKGFAQLGHYRK